MRLFSGLSPPSLLDQLMKGVSFYYRSRYIISDPDAGVLWDAGLPVDDRVFENGFEQFASLGKQP